MEILALIGLALILWHVSKVLKRLGSWLTEMSYAIADYVTELKKKTEIEDLKLRQQNIKVAEKIRIIKGGDSNVAYTNKVRHEIELIEKEINGVEE